MGQGNGKDRQGDDHVSDNEMSELWRLPIETAKGIQYISVKLKDMYNFKKRRKYSKIWQKLIRKCEVVIKPDDNIDSKQSKNGSGEKNELHFELKDLLTNLDFEELYKDKDCVSPYEHSDVEASQNNEDTSIKTTYLDESEQSSFIPIHAEKDYVNIHQNRKNCIRNAPNKCTPFISNLGKSKIGEEYVSDKLYKSRNTDIPKVEPDVRFTCNVTNLTTNSTMNISSYLKSSTNIKTNQNSSKAVRNKDPDKCSKTLRQKNGFRKNNLSLSNTTCVECYDSGFIDFSTSVRSQDDVYLSKTDHNCKEHFWDLSSKQDTYQIYESLLLDKCPERIKDLHDPVCKSCTCSGDYNTVIMTNANSKLENQKSEIKRFSNGIDLSKELYDHKIKEKHFKVEIDKRSHTRKYIPIDQMLIREKQREEKMSRQLKLAFLSYYRNLLDNFFEERGVGREACKIFSLTRYIEEFDHFISKDVSLSNISDRGKVNVIKLVILGVDLARHDRTYHVFPINGLQQYFEQMSVPTSARPAHAETMRYEWVRVRSFWSFPSNIRVSPIAMARVGFYYTGKCAECRCFSCGKVYREWRDGDDPMLVHQQISPNCAYLNGGESGNVPIHEEDRFKPRHHVDQTLYSPGAPPDTPGTNAETQAVTLPCGLSSSELSQIPVPHGSTQTADFSFRPPPQPPPVTPQSGTATQQPVVPSQLPGYFSQLPQNNQNVIQTQPGSNPLQTRTANSSPTTHESGQQASNQPSGNDSLTIGEQNVPSIRQREDTPRQPPLGSGLQSMPLPTQFNESTSVNRAESVPSSVSTAEITAGSQTAASTTILTGPTMQAPATAATTSSNKSTTSSSVSQPPPATTTTSTTGTTGGSSSSTAVTEPSRSRFDPLGINFEKPRYPAYAVLTVRINTYNGWPNYLDQTPRNMALAGFFYAGYGDYTRCFFCGGGLRNWEAGDDPWVEHARWFPKCAFLRQNRGDNYVRMVQTRHQEAEASNQPIQLPRQLSVLDEGRPANIMSSIPVQTLREMGKDDAIINQAIDRWRAYRQQTGRSHDNAELQATEIYEVILQIEEEREQGATALPTTGQQLALTQPTNQVVPQTSVAITGETTEQPTGAEATTDDLSYMEGFEKVLEEYEEQKDKLTCTICMENPVAIAFLPCGHLVCCLDCAPAMRKCPICNELVKGTIKTFFP